MSTAFTEFTGTISRTGTTLTLYMNMTMSGAAEEVAIDNLRLFDTAPCVNPTAFNVTGSGTYCSGGTGLMVGLSNSQTGVTYQLKNGAANVGSPVNGNGSAISFGLQTTATTYTVVATRTVGACTTTMTGSAVVTITNISLLANAQSNVSCNGGSNGVAAVNAATGGTAPYSYNWTPNNPAGDGTTLVTGLSAGTWTCTVTDANNCTATQTFTITQPTALVVTAQSQTNISCFGDSNGAARVNTPTGGTGGYTYNWTPGNPTGDGTTSISGLTSGTWTCTVTDANSCTATRTFTITQPIANLNGTPSTAAVSCFGGSNGTATITASGGTAGYTYLWSNGATTATASGLVAGTYSVTITDANSCQRNISNIVVGAPTAALNGTPSTTAVSCFGGSNGTATITASGGTAGYSYLWSNGATTATATGLLAGTYSITITDSKFCSKTVNNIVVGSPLAVTPPTASAQTFCGNATVANLTATGDNLKWYATNISSSTLATNTALIASTYFVSQTVAGCESARTSVAVSFPETIWTGTWSNGAPTATTKAIFSSNFTATASLSACAVAVSGTANVVFPSNFNLTVNNEVVVSASSTLTFENNSNLIQVNAATNTGNIVYKRNAQMNRLDYVYWSSPVANQKLLAFTPNTLPNRFYTYNEPTKLFTQVASPSTTNFDIGKGYSLRAPNNFFQAPAVAQTFVGIFTGVPNNGNISVPVTFTASPTGGIGFNLIGNPYPSTINATTFLNDNAGSLYFWTHQSFYDANNVLQNAGANNYATFNLSGAVAASITNGVNVVPNGTIQAGQGFMFLTTSSKNVTFTNTMRIANNADQFFRTAETAENSKIWLNLTNYNASSFSQTMVAYLPNTTSGFDDGYDAMQINASGNVLSSQIDTENYAIQSRGNFANSDVVKLNLNLTEAGNYTISKDNTTGIFNQSQCYFLKDNLLGTTHNIKQTPYNFVANAGTTANRFEIVYQGALSNNNNVFASESVIIFEQNGLLNISATNDLKSVKIFDVQGRNIFEVKNINSKTTILQGFRPQQQVLLLEITNNDNQVVTKKVVF